MIHQLLKRLSLTNDASEDHPIVTDNIRLSSKELLETILSHANMPSVVSLNEPITDIIYLDIQNDSQASYIIGKDGQTLIALQTIVRAQLFKKFQSYTPIFIDCNNYMANKIEKAQEKAQAVESLLCADTPMMELSPMSAIERKAIHTMYQHNTAIETSSIGSGHNRRVTLTLSSVNH